MSSVTAAVTPINWPKDSQKYDIYINEEGMYELVFGSQQPIAKNFRKHCCNVMFPQIRQQLANKTRKTINKPLKKRMQQLHCSMIN